VLRSAIMKFVDGDIRVRCPEGGCSGETSVPFLNLVDPPPAPKPERRYIVRRRRLVDSEPPA